MDIQSIESFQEIAEIVLEPLDDNENHSCVSSESGEVSPDVHKQDDLNHGTPSMSKQPSALFQVHKKVRPSILASDAHVHNYRGLYNLGAIVLVVMNLRLVIENLIKYGLLIKFPSSDMSKWPRAWPCFTACIGLFIPISLAYLIERIASTKGVTSRTAAVLHTLNITLTVLVPILIIHYTFATLISGMTCLFLSVLTQLKLISYAHTSHELRRLRDREVKDNNKVKNPRFLHLWYFIAAPTLCYQESYPMTPEIRLGFLARRFMEMLFCFGSMLFIQEQYINPTVKNALVHLDNGDAIYILERVLKLAIPNTIVWLFAFYGFFHGFLNFAAELLCFGDRLFYNDWWNAPSLDVYWRNWNIPVHHWLRRHIYAPLIERGLKPIQAQVLVFLLSAFFHELLVSVPCHTVKYWAFIGMFLQVPVVMLTRYLYKRLGNPVYGNIIFWFTFCIFGQPTLILMYSHHYVRTYLS